MLELWVGTNQPNATHTKTWRWRTHPPLAWPAWRKWWWSLPRRWAAWTWGRWSRAGWWGWWHRSRGPMWTCTTSRRIPSCGPPMPPSWRWYRRRSPAVSALCPRPPSGTWSLAQPWWFVAKFFLLLTRRPWFNVFKQPSPFFFSAPQLSDVSEWTETQSRKTSDKLLVPPSSPPYQTSVLNWPPFKNPSVT